MATKDYIVWRIHLKPALVDQFDLCKKNDVIGIGWPVDEVPRDCEHYLELVEKEYEKCKETGWKRSPRRFCEMQAGDIVWSQDPETEEFYIGEVEDPWEYRTDRDFEDAEIACTRPCELFKVDGYIRSGIKKMFEGYTDTVRKIHEDHWEWSADVLDRVRHKNN